MKVLELKKQDYEVKIGAKTPKLEPNITEDTIFFEGGEPIGFYLKSIPSRMSQLASLANHEFNSKNVPKQEMSRGPQGSKKDKALRAKEGKELVTQYSTILGAVPPKPHMRRDYPTISSVHRSKSAANFIKAMILLARESEELIKSILPEQYKRQESEIKENCPEEFRFGRLFTSSISNFNIPAPYHRDTANLKGCVNVIINKKKYSSGGHLHIPEYGAILNCVDDSIVVYPAWKSIHGVTPIENHCEKGYRNSLVFYPLSSFKKYVKGNKK